MPKQFSGRRCLQSTDDPKQGAFSRSRDSRNHRELIVRDGDGDVFEIMNPRAADLKEFLHGGIEFNYIRLPMTGYKSRRTFSIRQRLACQKCQAHDLFHLGEIDFLDRIGGLMIVGMEASEPPHGRDVVQGERKLVAALKYVQRRILVPFVIQA